MSSTNLLLYASHEFKSHPKKGGFSHRNDDSRNKKAFNKSSNYNNKPREPLFTTGSDRDQQWAKIVIGKLAEHRKSKIQLIKKGEVTNVKYMRDIFKGLDLRENGVVIVSEKDGEVKLKVVEQKVAMKEYSDYLAAKVTEQLREMDNSVVRRQDKNLKKEEGFKGKVVQVGWGITLNDLQGQKLFEVSKHLHKGFDVDIVFDERENLDKENSGSTLRNFSNELEEIEAIRREKLLSLIADKLDQDEIKFQRTGSINGRLVVSAKASAKNALSKQEKKDLKAAEKEARKQKLAERAAKKSRTV